VQEVTAKKKKIQDHFSACVTVPKPKPWIKKKHK